MKGRRGPSTIRQVGWKSWRRRYGRARPNRGRQRTSGNAPRTYTRWTRPFRRETCWQRPTGPRQIRDDGSCPLTPPDYGPRNRPGRRRRRAQIQTVRLQLPNLGRPVRHSVPDASDRWSPCDEVNDLLAGCLRQAGSPSQFVDRIGKALELRREHLPGILVFNWKLRRLGARGQSHFCLPSSQFAYAPSYEIWSVCTAGMASRPGRDPGGAPLGDDDRCCPDDREVRL